MKRLVQHPAFHLTAIALLCLVGFGRALSRYFVSEDFVILGQLADQSLWSAVWQHLTGPVLNLPGSYFYRPVGLALLAVEQCFWGVAPSGYLWTHLSVHVLNAALLYRLVRLWVAGRELAWGIALIFALHPLHPNTVLFVASYATLFSVPFSLASLWLYERHRDGNKPSLLAASALCFGLALGAYEQAIILPLIVLGRELLLAGGRPERAGGRLFQRLVALSSVVALYILARRTALGAVGLSAWSGQWLGGFELPRLGRMVLENAVRLAVPVYEYETPAALLLAMGVLLLIVSVWSLAGLRRGSRPARLWLFGLLWVLASQAPLGASTVTPATGRYFYLASIGLGAMLVAGVLMLVGALYAVGLRLRPVAAKALVAAIVTAVGLGYLGLLARNADVYAVAGEITRSVQGQLAGLRHDGEQRVFVTGHPMFLRGPRGVPTAQLFQWGLADALRPPFMDTQLIVHPLPELSDTALLPLLERPGLGAVWRWRSTSMTLERAHLPAPEGLPRVASRGPQQSAPGPRLRFRALGDARHRLVLVTRGGSGFYPAEDLPAGDGWSDAPLPAQFLRWMDKLYGGPSYAWIEARQPDGRLSAVSRLHVVGWTG